jgi:(E)-4-hydroxy-3-methylbut-2-enyl-diphosphate synthase
VIVGDVGVGAKNPLRIQSMTTTDTQDVEATVEQASALDEVGCEIIRITAPNVAAAKCLREIRRKLQKRRIYAPLVADIHFLPSAALEAAEHVEKIRINPGNYADKKKFAVQEYSDGEYEREIQRLYEDFSPLVKRCRQLGRSMRIGTNHGSLSDRIMNRYGDTPLGMVESALEFLRIAESHDYRQIILSMKASNPKVMIEAYRLLVERMDQEEMNYPLHLGVTEAGDGEDGRIKSAIGIGSLLLDGLGDTIRVSLTEDPVYEIPVAQVLANKAMKLWQEAPFSPSGEEYDSIDPYHFTKRETEALALSQECQIGKDHPPRIIVNADSEFSANGDLAAKLATLRSKLTDTPIEGIFLTIADQKELETVNKNAHLFGKSGSFLILSIPPTSNIAFDSIKTGASTVIHRKFSKEQGETLLSFTQQCQAQGFFSALDINPDEIHHYKDILTSLDPKKLIFTFENNKPLTPPFHTLGLYRKLFEELKRLKIASPIWIRNTADNAIEHTETFLDRLLEASVLSGALLCDGLGDFVSFETEDDIHRAIKVSYNLLQGAGARISKTEFVACPSCGRTLFDLQTTTQRIREKTGHLKGVKIAIMGCIVNGPGEMADADFGYVGGAPGKINLYVGKDCIKYNIPADEADQCLIELIKAHGRWVDPTPEQAMVSS